MINESATDKLTWAWKRESMKDTLKGMGKFKQTNFLNIIIVRLVNYGVKFNQAKIGIKGGPIQLIGKNNVTMNFSNSSWSYKISLNGEAKRLYDPLMRASSKTTFGFV
ncbi:hypothetical protein K1719_036302 [Acacia pycnantha]|nr:hypothetical protein K1719_036302 [Acacia pycnantha]